MLSLIRTAAIERWAGKFYHTYELEVKSRRGLDRPPLRLEATWRSAKTIGDLGLNPRPS
jgi:hypothetical protein